MVARGFSAEVVVQKIRNDVSCQSRFCDNDIFNKDAKTDVEGQECRTFSLFYRALSVFD